jgi:hypothetical protein
MSNQCMFNLVNIGPIVDNSKEMPYEMVNALYVRPIDGRNIYMVRLSLNFHHLQKLKFI